MLNDSQMDDAIAHKIYLVHQTPFHTEAVSEDHFNQRTKISGSHC